MARTRAKDYDEKRGLVLKGAAALFARDGYDRASMASLAGELGVSKALLYHYYSSKEALLFDIIETHLQTLLDAVEEADLPDAEPEERLHRLVSGILDAYRDADDEHKVQIGALHVLPDDQQEAIRSIERRIVRIVADAVLALNPALNDGRTDLKPATMSLFGMLNWFYMWFREGGSLTREDYAKMVSTIFIGGIRKL
ncbi:MAG: TetR/AcrR family transcriptional regulator [Pseudomonadota bacterium]